MATDFVLLTEAEVTKLKVEIRARDGNRCTKCGMLREEHLLTYCRDLEVHRLIPGCEYDSRYCTTLCLLCHKREPTKLSAEETARVLEELGLPQPVYRHRFMLHTEDYRIIESAARKVGVTPSAFLKQAVLKAATTILKERSR